MSDLTESEFVDLYWRSAGDGWAIPDEIMVAFGRAVAAKVWDQVADDCFIGRDAIHIRTQNNYRQARTQARQHDTSTFALSNGEEMTIENTKDRDPLLHLMGIMGEGQSGYITGMESAGQRQLVTSDTIPTSAPWDDLIALGFVRGEAVKGDDLFTHVTLPTGWGKAATDHAMWSDIYDERGVKRVAVFYKAAFYDRRADCHLVSPGGEAVTHVIYGDEPVALPEKWDVFTEDERDEYRESLGAEIQRDEESIRDYPSLNSDGRYTNYIKRAQAALKLAA